jgi:hypothetical protein
MDNYFKQCPAMISDSGRELGDFSTSIEREERIKAANNIWRDDLYRLFLQTHATELMDREWDFYSRKNQCVANTCVFNNNHMNSSPLDYAKEMATYNMTFNSKKYGVCKKYKDQRLNPKC